MAKEITVRVSADPSAFMQAIGQINGALDKADKHARKTSAGFIAFGNSLTSVGTGLVASITAPLIGIGAASLKASADMEVLTMGLTSVMRDSKSAAAEMVKLKELARLPGLDLEGAVRGSIRLQTLGRSADSSRRIMGELANAIAIAGGGKDDFSEVTRQLSQMQAVGKVTKENLDTITERIPAISKIMLDTWGPESLGDPAKFFEKAGISSAKFIEILTDKMAQGARAGNTFKNSFENAVSDTNQALVQFGDALKPIAQQFLDDFATPVIKKVTELATAFKELPQSTQTISVITAGIAAAVPIAVVALGSFLTHLGTVKLAAAGAIESLKGLGSAFSVVGAAATAGGVAAGLFLGWLLKSPSALREQKKASDEAAEGMKRINDRFLGVRPAVSPAYEALLDFTGALKTVPPPADDAAKATGELAKKMPALAKVTAESEVLMRLMAEAVQAKAAKLDKAADILRTYGTVSIDTAIGLAKAADAQFLLNRALDEAPDLQQKFEFKDLPKFDGKISGGDFGEFERMGKNIGEFGMQTKEQYDAMKQAAKDSAKGQSAALRQVSTIITDLSSGIARSIIQWKGWGETLKSVAQNAGQAIIRELIEKGLSKVASKLLDVGGLFGKVFGGGTGVIKSAVPAVNSTINTAGGIGGAIGSGVKSGGGAVGSIASSSLTSIVGAVSGVVSAVSGVISNFQFMAMNKSLDLIEKEVRYSQIHLLNTLNKANEYWPYLKSIHERLFEIRSVGVAIQGGGTVINNNLAGAFVVGDRQIGELADLLARHIKARL